MPLRVGIVGIDDCLPNGSVQGFERRALLWRVVPLLRARTEEKNGSERGRAHCPNLVHYALYMYLMFGLKISRFGAPSRFTFKQHLSYHSMMPSSVSPSFSTMTMGVFDCICFI